MNPAIPEAEILERAALEDLHRAIPRPVASELGVQGLTIGSAFASMPRPPLTPVVLIESRRQQGGAGQDIG